MLSQESDACSVVVPLFTQIYTSIVLAFFLSQIFLCLSRILSFPRSPFYVLYVCCVCVCVVMLGGVCEFSRKAASIPLSHWSRVMSLLSDGNRNAPFTSHCVNSFSTATQRRPQHNARSLRHYFAVSPSGGGGKDFLHIMDLFSSTTTIRTLNCTHATII